VGCYGNAIGNCWRDRFRSHGAGYVGGKISAPVFAAGLCFARIEERLRRADSSHGRRLYALSRRERPAFVIDFRTNRARNCVGWVEQDCIRCFYHGWKYDGSGQCVEQPAESESFAGKIKLRSCPTEEYLGLIFAYFGDGAAPPFPRYAALEQTGEIDVGSYIRYCNYFNTLENGIDQAHVPFTHAKSNFTQFGLNWDIPTITAEESDYGIICTARRW
jgi:hypothetical protein